MAKIDFVIGMPPGTYLSDVIMENSMPTATITPCKPDFSQGLSLFRLEESMSTFNDELIKLGYSVNKSAIEVAFLADNFPSDSFVNDYGETFLQKFTDVASQGMAQLAQMTGAQTGTQAIKQYGNILAGFGDMEGVAGKAFGAAGKAFSAPSTGLKV